MTTLSKFQQRLRETIISQLELSPMSVAEIAGLSKFNYHSVRGAMRALESEGIIKPVDGHSYRNVKFTVGSDHGPNNIIPMIRLSGDNVFKLQTLLELRKQSKSNARDAVTNLPRHIVRILMASIRLHRDGVNPELTMASLRVEMERDLKAINSMSNVYEQVLNDSKIWSVDLLRRFPDDVTFDADEVTKAYSEYFLTEPTED